MAIKKRKTLGIDDDFKSLTVKERKSKLPKLDTEKMAQQANITGNKAVKYGFAGGVTQGKRGIGAIKTKAEEQKKTQKKGEDIYKDSDGKVVSKLDSKIDTKNKYTGKKNKLGTDKGNKLDRIEKRVAKRQGQKEERKNYRAAKLAKRRGMSPEQAKDFMQNRRTRLNQAVGEFGKAIATGGQMDWGKLDKRLYKKDGSGTLQNMKNKDGGTYDATAPYKGTAAKGYSDRGMARKEKDGYTKIMGPKVNIAPADPIKLNAFRSADKPKEAIQATNDDSKRNIGNKINIELTKGPDQLGQQEIKAGEAFSGTSNSTASNKVYNADQRRILAASQQKMDDGVFKQAGNFAKKVIKGGNAGELNMSGAIPGFGSGIDNAFKDRSAGITYTGDDAWKNNFKFND